ncbi:hypothetical protein [Haloarchaeobius sp. DFWS5]|uniref:hypothetical protein n=1 Tax=Haloarchaeobius sp. DFWS5 TaxID=3446114 RepID=UPI003EC0EAE4
MTPPALREYVDHAEAVLAETDSLGLRNTQLRLVEPLLSALGWDVRETGVEAEYALPSGHTVDYALCCAGVPGVFVAAVAADDSLTAADGEALTAAMRDATVDHGLLTNGRRFAFVALRDDDEDGFTAPLSDLPANESTLEQYTRAATAARLESRDDVVRKRAADAIDAERDALETAILDTVLAVTGGDARDVLADETATFVDDLVSTLGDEAVAGSAATADTNATAGSREFGEHDDESPAVDNHEHQRDEPDETVPTTTANDADSTASGAVDDSMAADDSTTTSDSTTTADDPTIADDVQSVSATAADDDGEFVVRFFDDRSSIGAVGSSTEQGTMGQAVDYLVENHHLAAGLSLPYDPEDDGYAVLHREPVHPNGEPMRPAVQLATGPYLWTGGDRSERKTRLETIASRAGLRVMFQGDW